MAYKRGQILREQGMRAKKHITLDEIGRRLALWKASKTDSESSGVMWMVRWRPRATHCKTEKVPKEIVVRVIHKAVGAITESDVTLANASTQSSSALMCGLLSGQPGWPKNEIFRSNCTPSFYNAIEENQRCHGRYAGTHCGREDTG